MFIADAQVHIWESGTPVYHHRQVSRYTKDELLREMDAGGVNAALLHRRDGTARQRDRDRRAHSIPTGSRCSASAT